MAPLDEPPAESFSDVRRKNQNYPHLMVDTETMGRCAGALPFAIRAVPFSVEESKIGRPLRVHIDFEDALRYEGLRIEAGTTVFWMEQSESWLRMQKATVSLDEALQYLRAIYERVCAPDAKVWARGKDFDFGLVLRPAYDAIGRELPWEYSDQRDHRTLGFDRPEHEHVHDPVADAVAQARQIIEAPQQVQELL